MFLTDSQSAQNKLKSVKNCNIIAVSLCDYRRECGNWILSMKSRDISQKNRSFHHGYRYNSNVKKERFKKALPES